MRHTTREGTVIEVGRISRQEIDCFIMKHPLPEPPTREVAAFGDTVEELPVWDAPEYQRQLFDYYLTMGYDQAGLIVGAVEVVEPEPDVILAEAGELQRLGLGEVGSKADLLRWIVLADPEDMGAVVEDIFYQSTVTERGIAEARALFDVRWSGQPIEAWHVPGTPGRYSGLFEARLAARFAGVFWPAFCELPGPEQSAHVCFFRLANRLEWLMMKQK